MKEFKRSWRTGADWLLISVTESYPQPESVKSQKTHRPLEYISSLMPMRSGKFPGGDQDVTGADADHSANQITPLNAYMNRVLLISSLVVLLGCAWQVSAASLRQYVTVQTPLGPVKGFSEHNYITYRGIQYGTAQRWQAPQPVKSWAPSVYSATNFGSCCPSIGTSGQASEECLFLNIWSPASNTTGLKPVMFYIHGGGYLFGCGSDGYFDGSYFSNTSDVVVVTINYRLGAFGFLALNDIKGNFGIMDMQLALDWVQQNIASFGGDPNAVTIFGQSAGGISIATLLTSPISIAKGHYQRAIAQSDPMALLFRTPQEQQKFGGLFSTLLGCPIAGSTQCLLSRSTAQILNVTLLEIELPFDNFGWKSVVSRMPWFPTIDGVVITASPLDAFATGQVADVPILLGAVANETLGWADLVLQYLHAGNTTSTDIAWKAATVALFGPTFAPKIWYAYPLASRSVQALTEVMGRVTTDFMFWCAQRFALQSLINTPRKSPVYAYYWLYGPPIDSMNDNTACHFHACHSVEVPYVWRSQPHVTKVPFTPAQWNLANSFAAAFANFAHGNPEWPPLTQSNTPVMIFDQVGSYVSNDWQQDLCDIWDTVGYHN